MANKVSGEMEAQVLELKKQGKTIRKIAYVLKVSRNTVSGGFWVFTTNCFFYLRGCDTEILGK